MNQKNKKTNIILILYNLKFEYFKFLINFE